MFHVFSDMSSDKDLDMLKFLTSDYDSEKSDTGSDSDNYRTRVFNLLWCEGPLLSFFDNIGRVSIIVRDRYGFHPRNRRAQCFGKTHSNKHNKKILKP